MIAPDTPLRAVRGVGPVTERRLGAAGLETVQDLLHVLPFRYEDRRTVVGPGAVRGGEAFAVQGRLGKLRRIRLRRRGMSLIRGEVAASGERLTVVWFNRPYLLQQVDEDTEYLLYGAVRERGSGLELVNPSVEPATQARLAAAVVPVYPTVGEIGPAQIRRLVTALFDQDDPRAFMPETLPEALRRKHQLPPLGEALDLLHRPGNGVEVEQLNGWRTGAHHRLIYGELLDLQLRLIKMRAAVQTLPKEHRYELSPAIRERLLAIAPFVLTDAQRRATAEILDDMGNEQPMMRLLQGDVGSGKTIVAAIALAAAAENGLQGVLMAPTELLAEQHYQSLRKVLDARYCLRLLTGSTGDAGAVRAGIAAGEISLAVGTHALIQQQVSFHRLGVVVVDEQHRFGVAQRRDLQHKGNRPDLLVMTATPIPRSLALTAYGDLALSVIDELPPGRSPVSTQVLPTSDRAQALAATEEALANGEQVYVVLPLIEESDKVAAASIAGLGVQWGERLAAFSPVFLHGKLSGDDRIDAMRSFVVGRSRVLIATTMIEVGVDVPQATVMIIESAERFGLSQLHQLRGRVGRGGGASRCIALYNRRSDGAAARLQVFADTQDGFRIAEADMEIRGPGDLLGTRQAGLPLFKVANIVRDRLWIERAREDAAALVAGDVTGAAPVAASSEAGDESYDRLAGG